MFENILRLRYILFGGFIILVLVSYPLFGMKKPAGVLDAVLPGNHDLLYFATDAPDNFIIYSPGLNANRGIHSASERMSDMVVSPDGSVVWTATKSGYIDRYEIPQGDAGVSSRPTHHSRIAPVLSSIALSADGQFVAVGYGNSEDYNSRSIKILKSDTVSIDDEYADFSVSGDIQDIVANPVRGLFYVINSHSDRVRIYNVDRFRLERDIIELGNSPGQFVVHPNGERAYAAMNARNQVTPVDLITNETVESIPLGFPPYAMAFNVDGSHLYVASRDSSRVVIIDTETDSVLTAFDLPPRMEGVVEANFAEIIAISTDENYLYVLPKRQELIVYDISEVRNPANSGARSPMVQSHVLTSIPLYMNVIRGYEIPGI